jgi:hypothetical protein
MHTIQWSVPHVRTALICALASVTISGSVVAKPNLDGAWKITKPQALLMPANGEPVPLTPAGKKAYEQNKASAQQGKYGFDEVMERCGSPGMPRIMLAPNQFKIFDRRDLVMFKFEWNRLFRQVDLRDDATIARSKAIPLTNPPSMPGGPRGGGPPDGGPPGGAPPGGAPPPGGPPGAGGAPGGPPGAGGPPGGPGGSPPADPLVEAENLIGSQMGRGRGHWEGDVLVVETTKLADYKLLDGLVQASDQLKLVERIRLKDKNTLEDRITISDPETFTKSWDVVLTYKRQPDQEMAEDVCLDRRQAGESPWLKPL